MAAPATSRSSRRQEKTPARTPLVTGRPALVMGIVATVWALVVGSIVVGLVAGAAWLSGTDGSQPWTGAIGTVAATFTVVNGVPFGLGDASVSLLPWGWTLLPIALLGYGGRWAAARSRLRGTRDAVLLVAGGAVVYAVAVASAAVLGRGLLDTWSVSTMRAFGTALVLSAVMLAAGAVTTDAAEPLRARVPLVVRSGLHAGAIALAALVGAAALLLAVGMGLAFGEAVDITAYLDGGIVGNVVILLLGLGYLPVLMTWSLAYLLGAPVVLSGGTVVSPFLANTGGAQMPAFPLLAAIPESASPVLWALPVLGVAAGVLAGWWAGRRNRGDVRAALLVAALAAVVAAVGVAVLALASTGAVGSQWLSGLGPSPIVAGAFAAVLVGLGALPTAVATQHIRKPRVVADAAADDTTVADDAPAADEPAVEPAAEHIAEPADEDVVDVVDSGVEPQHLPEPEETSNG